MLDQNQDERTRVLGVGSALLLLASGAVAQSGFAECAHVQFEVSGEAGGNQFGWVSAPIPDLDGDLVTEVAVSAPFFSGSRGKVYVYSGATGTELFSKSGTQVGAQLGYSVRCAGDVDADGIPDVIAGAPGNTSVAGTAVVFSGVDMSIIHTIGLGATSDFFGASVAGVGDCDVDGIVDLAIGATLHDSAGSNAGRVWIVSGLDGTTVLQTLDGETSLDNFGTALANVGDMSGDGRPELGVGAAAAGTGSGKAYVYDLAASSLWFEVSPDATAGSFGQFFVASPGDTNDDDTPDFYVSDFSDSEGGPGAGKAYVYSGTDGSLLWKLAGDSANDGFGIGRGVGDVNGDNKDDLILCGWVDSEGAPQAGKASIVSGADGSILRTIVSTTASETFGFDAHGMGDVDGDLRPDYFVTAAQNDSAGFNAGKVYLILGAEPVATYGQPLAGTGGLAPSIAVASGCPEIGTAFTIGISNGAAGAPGVLVVGSFPADIPFAGGSALVIPMLTLSHSLDGLGAAAFPTSLPADPALVGTELYLQAGYLDAGAAAGISLTEGLALILG